MLLLIIIVLIAGVLFYSPPIIGKLLAFEHKLLSTIISPQYIR